MTIEQGLYYHVVSQAAITSLIATRFYPVVIRQNTAFPCGSYQRITTPRIRSHDGPSGLASPLFQIDWWVNDQATGSSRMQALVDVSEAARRSLDGFRGLMGTVHVDAVHLMDERDDYDDETKLRRRMQDYEIWHQEDQPLWL